MTVLGLDIGGTKLAAAAFTADGRELVREVVPVAGRRGAEVGAAAVALLERVRTAVAAADRSIAAVGAIVPGIYHSDSGRVWAPNIPDWDDYPLLDELQAAAGADVAVRVDSDRAGSILGETWLGEARGCRHAVFVAVGTGIGAGIMVDGRILRGARDIAGATGWMALDASYREEYAEGGCFEYNASGPGIVRVAHDRLRESADASTLRDLDTLTTADIFSAAEVGDHLAAGVIDNAVAYWGMAAANYVSLFDPEIIVFGGGVFGPAAQYIDRIHAEAVRWAQPISMPHVRFAVSSLGGNAGLLGAGHLALRALDPATGQEP